MNGIDEAIDNIEATEKYLRSIGENWYADILSDAVELLKEQEQKCGKWERITGMAPPEYHGHRICSICECFAPYDPLHMGREILPKYCPGCGAEMDGEERCKAVDRNA